MRLTIERRLAVAFSLALEFLIVNAVISYRATRTLIRNEQSVTQTLQVLNELEATLTMVVNAETGERGYIISGDETFLEPYRAALDGINEHIKGLKQLTADNPNRQARLPLLERKIADRLDYLKRQIALRKSGDVEGVRQVIVSGAGKTLMDEIRKLIAEMEDEENDLLKRRAGESEASARIVTLSFAIASFTAAASFALLYGLAIRGLAERRRSADAIRDQREWLHVTLSSIGDAVIATDTNGRVTFMNSVTEYLTGWNRREAIGRPLGEIFQIVNAQTRQPAENPAARVLREGAVLGMANHTRLIARDGTEIPIDDSAAPIKSADALIGVVMVFRDVTERHRVEEERERLLARERAAHAEAESANRAKDEFLATVSHELRTPLNAILGWSRLLRIGQLDAQAAGKALESVENNAKAQSQLIEDLLDVSRIISGKLRINYEQVNLVTVIEAALETARPAAQAKSIQLSAELDSAAGAVMGDATRLQQVIWNLLSNAVKFTPKDGRVEIRLKRDDSHAQVTVSDTGQGISPDFLPHVFDRFRQADSKDTRRHGGLGLGLAIVRHLVEMHGGAVNSDSPGEGQGATFTVRLPLKTAQTETGKMIEEQAANSSPLLDRLPALDGVKVLAVDDESSAREIITAVLSQCGATVTAVASAADAITVLAQSRPDVLVIDIGMPDENGYELISKARKLKPEQGGNIPAVALTAYARTEDRMRALAAGFQSHVPKPVEPAELALVVASLMQGKRETG
jgi:PAS domain S-box-containing protein